MGWRKAKMKREPLTHCCYFSSFSLYLCSLCVSWRITIAKRANRNVKRINEVANLFFAIIKIKTSQHFSEIIRIRPICIHNFKVKWKRERERASKKYENRDKNVTEHSVAIAILYSWHKNKSILVKMNNNKKKRKKHTK